MTSTTFAPNEVWEYLPGRHVAKGDKIRISGGPVWIDAKGVEHSIGERGLYTFCYQSSKPDGSDPYIVASGDAGASVVFMLEPKRPRFGISGWKNRPYRFAKLRAAR